MKFKTINFDSPQRGNPFTMCFVISKYKGNLLLKGCHHKIKKYRNTLPKPYIYRYTYWKNGSSRGGWMAELSNDKRLYISEPQHNGRPRPHWDNTIPRKHSFWGTVKGKENECICLLTLRRIPNKWIYDEIIERLIKAF
jgi:hypothetical protein